MQVDGTFGAGAGIAEMLMQSYGGEVSLLPALPKEWADGHVRGLRARGGFELGFSWKDGKLRDVTIRSLLGKVCRVRYGEKVKEFATQPTKTYTLNADLQLQ